jgi:tryptophan synthase alpha chain
MKPDRYRETFLRLKKEGRSAFIPFTVIGDPNLRTSLKVLQAFVRGGADILELGVPFSDPVADGPINQRAAERALAQGVTTDRVFSFVREARKTLSVPIGLLCYYNIVMQYGLERFFKRAGEAGVDSVLVADASLEESEGLYKASLGTPVKTVLLVTELSDKTRIKRIAQKTTGFLYLVSRLGVTGVQSDLSRSIRGLVRRVRLVTRLPICVGFGVSGPAHARALRKTGVDGIICGSAIVKLIEEYSAHPSRMLKKVESFTRIMKRAAS